MYIPGRWRTGSSPERIVMLPASYCDWSVSIGLCILVCSDPLSHLQDGGAIWSEQPDGSAHQQVAAASLDFR
jgi:hypothetical protein